jgi:thiamine phosphate synthase YjbQ (UPF0047 family)
MQLRAWELTRASRLVIIQLDREILLGQYQSIIVAELDGPRERRLQLQIVGE